MTTILTKALRAKLLENGQAQRAAIRNGSDDLQPIDPYPVVKLFTPDAGATWLLTELDPEDDDLAFGLMDLGLGEPELGYVRVWREDSCKEVPLLGITLPHGNIRRFVGLSR